MCFTRWLDQPDKRDPVIVVKGGDLGEEPFVVDLDRTVELIGAESTGPSL